MEGKGRVSNPLSRNWGILYWQLEDLIELSDFNDAHERDKHMLNSRLSPVDFYLAAGEEVKAK